MTASHPADLAKLEKTFSERGIRKVKVGGFDIDGVLRGKYVSLDKFWSAAKKGFGFCDVVFGWDIGDVLYDNARITGWHTGYPDVHAAIDLETFRVSPYEPDTACFLADFYWADGTPHTACPRNLLKRMIGKALDMGFKAFFSAEFEFWVFKERSEDLYAKGFRNLEPLSKGMFGYSWVRESQNAPFLHEILDTMTAFDIEIEGLHTETGPGVYEAAIRYDELLRAADKAALFKTMMKQVAARHGLSVTFMAKWNADLPGSSGHLHQSLWTKEGDRNVFSETSRESGLSEIMMNYIAGQLTLMPELTALYAPTVNAYKRYVPGVWAPLNASWGIENRTSSIRVIQPDPSGTRVEYRQTAADINPYIAMATCLGAGLYGIEHKLLPPPSVSGDASATSNQASALPLTLADATARLQKSERAREVLGAGFVDHYVRTREWEVRQYQKAVSDWELRRYFEAI